jgi:hypothetical protein
MPPNEKRIQAFHEISPQLPDEREIIMLAASIAFSSF